MTYAAFSAALIGSARAYPRELSRLVRTHCIISCTVSAAVFVATALPLRAEVAHVIYQTQRACFICGEFLRAVTVRTRARARTHAHS